MDQLGQLRQVIEQWNQNRLDLFELSLPNEDLEFHGVMRFYFQDAGQKVATKCIRVSSTATAIDVINTLIEKFRPDIRMLSHPEYAIYEIHENGGERRLADEEQPLLVQLNWHKDDREGRFLLRRMDEKTYLPGFAPEQSHFKRKLSKREKKEMKKLEKKKAKDTAKENSNNNNHGTNGSPGKGDQGDHGKNGIAEKLYTEIPETSFTRSISNPEAVMRRRRQQKLEKKLQQLCQEGGPEAGGTLRIFGETLNKDVPYKTLLLSTRDTAFAVVREILEKYGRDRDEAHKYCLVQLIHSLQVTPNGLDQQQHDFNGNPSHPGTREYILDDDECPLAIERQHSSRTRGSLTFHIRPKPANYQPRKKKKQSSNSMSTRGDLMDRLQFNQQEMSMDNNVNNGDQQLMPPPMAHLHGQQSQSQFQQQQHVQDSDQRSVSTNSQSNSQSYCPSEQGSNPVVPQSPSILANEQSANQGAAGQSQRFFDFQEQDQPQVSQLMRPGSQSSQSFGVQESKNVQLGGGMSLPQPLVRTQQQTKVASQGPEVHVYLMQKGNGGMGLSIVATKGLGQEKSGIFIKSVVPEGAAFRDGRLEAGDQILKINGTDLAGMSQEEAANLIKETGSDVTLEVAKSAATFYGLWGILSNSSTTLGRHRISSHQQSSSSTNHHLLNGNVSNMAHSMSAQQLPPQFRTMPTNGHQSSLYQNQTLPSSMSLQGFSSQTNVQAQPPPQLVSKFDTLQEERHYQNIGMYQRQQMPPNGQMPPQSSTSTILRTHGGPQIHHNSYGSLAVPPGAPGPQMLGGVANGRPLSTAYAPNGQMIPQQRVNSMAQYPGQPGILPSLSTPLFRTPHSGSVPALHHQHYPNHGQPSFVHPMYQSGTNGNGQFMRPPVVNQPFANPRTNQDQVPVPISYRPGRSGYPSGSNLSGKVSSNDTLNNNVQNLMNNNVNHGPMTNGNSGQQWPRRTKHSSAAELSLSGHIEEQSERFRLLRLEELRRKQIELENAQLAEDRLLKEAKTRSRQDEMDPRLVRSHYPVKHDSQSMMDQDSSCAIGGHGHDVPPPLPKSPPPADEEPQQVTSTKSMMIPSNQRVIHHRIQMSDQPVSVLRTSDLNSNVSNGSNSNFMSSSPPKKMVSWNDTAVIEVNHEEEDNEDTNGHNGGDQSESSPGFTLQDIDEVLGTSSAEVSNLLPNTPNVIGAQEVYRDPRERIREEKLKQNQVTHSHLKHTTGPEKLSFQEKMKMFAMTEAANNSSNYGTIKRSSEESQLQDVQEEISN